MTEVKPAARRRLLEERKSMPADERERADRSTWNALQRWLSEAIEDGATVAAYRPFGAEPGAMLKPELPERLAKVYKVLLPVVLPDNDLDWTELGVHAAQGGAAGDEWRGRALTGPRGTEEVAVRSGVAAIARANAVIVPALAVSHDGMRLGRGGGSYDRALARIAPGVPVIALLRDGEFGVEVPTEQHDRPVSGVITPSEGFRPVE